MRAQLDQISSRMANEIGRFNNAVYADLERILSVSFIIKFALMYCLQNLIAFPNSN